MTSAVPSRKVNVLAVISDKYATFKIFDKTFNPEFIKSPLSETVKIKIVISLVTTSGNIDFDFSEKSQYFIEKHITKSLYIICNKHGRYEDSENILPIGTRSWSMCGLSAKASHRQNTYVELFSQTVDKQSVLLSRTESPETDQTECLADIEYI